MLVLHSFCQSGNAYKVALMLRALGLPFETRFVDFFNGATRDPHWRQTVNAMGEVPVLEDGERKISQSAVILRYLSRLHAGLHGHPGPAFGGASDEEALEVERWLFFDNHKFTANMASMRFLKSFGAQAPDPAVMAFLRGRVEAAYGVVNRHLESRDWLVGNAPTLADFSLCGYVFYLAQESGLDISAQFSNIDAWRRRLQALPYWAHPYDILPGERMAPRW